MSEDFVALLRKHAAMAEVELSPDAGLLADAADELFRWGLRAERVQEFVTRFGMIDGACHKQWVLDQVMRLVLEEDYAAWAQKMSEDPDYDPWDVGIPP